MITIGTGKQVGDSKDWGSQALTGVRVDLPLDLVARLAVQAIENVVVIRAVKG